MSRNTLLALFFFVFSLSLYFFIRKDLSVTFDNLPLQNKPYLILHNFKYYKYLNDRAIKYLEGNTASLVNVDRIELSGDVKGWRYRTPSDTKKEQLEASFVQAHLNVKRIEDFQRPVNVTDTFLGGGVMIRHENLVINTQEAHYLGNIKNSVVGDQPVRARLNNQSIDADNGFLLDLTQETIELIGPVQGVINPDEKK